MPSSSTARTALPEIGLPSECQLDGHPLGNTERKPAKRAKRVEDDASAAEGNALAAPWFDAGVGAYPKASSYAESLPHVTEGDLSNMRAGARTVALRQLLPMQEHAPSALAFCRKFLADVDMSEHRDAVLELAAMVLQEIGYEPRPIPQLTRSGLGALLIEDFDDDGLGRQMMENAARKRGISKEQVALALRGPR